MAEEVCSLTVKRCDDGRLVPCSITILDQGDLVSLITLQEQVVSSLRDKSDYIPLTAREMKELLGEKGLTVGVLAEGKLEAFSSIFYPGLSGENLGREVGLSSSELLQVAQMESIIVNPLFRGNGLQKLTAKILHEKTFQNGRFRFLMAMVAPDNIVSINNTYSQGMSIVKLVKKNSYWRYIFFLDRHKQRQINSEEVIAVGNEDIKRQVMLLQDGFIGIRQEISAMGSQIIFAK